MTKATGCAITVIDVEGTLLYNIGDFNAISAKPNGKYAFTVTDLVTEITYNGNVWVCLHNPAGTEIVVSAIVFVP